MAAGDVVVERAALAQRHPDQVALGGVGRLADRLRHLACLAVTEADAPLLVADHHERGKAKAPATLDYLGHAIDVDELVRELALFPLALSFAMSWFTCHGFRSSFLGSTVFR